MTFQHIDIFESKNFRVPNEWTCLGLDSGIFLILGLFGPQANSPCFFLFFLQTTLFLALSKIHFSASRNLISDFSFRPNICMDDFFDPFSSNYQSWLFYCALYIFTDLNEISYFSLHDLGQRHLFSQMIRLFEWLHEDPFEEMTRDLVLLFTSASIELISRYWISKLALNFYRLLRKMELSLARTSDTFCFFPLVLQGFRCN